MEEYIISIDDENSSIMYSGSLCPSGVQELEFAMLKLDRANCEQVQTYKEGEKLPIKLLINSYGGLVDSIFGFLDFVSALTSEVYTYNMGCCASAALYMFLSGKKRFCGKYSSFMLHQAYIEKASNINSTMMTDIIEETVKKRDLVINGLFVKNTKLTAEEVEYMFDLNKDIYFSCEEALGYGIATDEISVGDLL